MIKKNQKLFTAVSLTLVLTILFGCFAVFSVGAVREYNGKKVKYDKSGTFGYVENDTGLTIVDYTKKTKSVKFPSTINGKKVTEIKLYEALEGSSSEEVWLSNYPKTVKIPATVTKIGYEGRIAEYVVSKNNKVYSSKDGVLYNKDKTKLKKFPPQKKCDSFKVPKTVKVICDFAFQCTTLEKVTLPKGLEIIGKRAFEDCVHLEKVNLPSTLKVIRSQAFLNCDITKFTLPKSLERMGKYSVASYTDESYQLCYSRKYVTVVCYKNSVGHKFAKKHKLNYKVK